MEALQNYLFENSHDFPECHYINMMDLLLKAHQSIEEQEPAQFFNYVHNRDISRIESSRNHMGIVGSKEVITEEYWNDHFKSIIEEAPDRKIRREQFIAKLKLINDQPTHFVFRNFIPRILRHKIHELNSFDTFITKTTSRTWNDQAREYSGVLNIFVN